MVKGGREGKLEKKEKWKMEKTMALVADVRRAGMRERIFPFHTKAILFGGIFHHWEYNPILTK